LIITDSASRVLFLDIQLRTPLLRFANIMLILGFKLRVAVSSDSSDGPPNCTRDPIRDAGPQVTELALSFLGLAVGILFSALLLETLCLLLISVLREDFGEGAWKYRHCLKNGGGSTNLRAYKTTNELLA
jgi:hypothetical protein